MIQKRAVRKYQVELMMEQDVKSPGGCETSMVRAWLVKGGC